MVKTRTGWYLQDSRMEEERKRIMDDKEARLEMRRIAMMKRCDNKIARHRLQVKQRETINQEELLHARKAVDLRRKEVELTHRLAAELSQRKNKEVKRDLESRRIKSFALPPSSCIRDDTRSRLIEDKVRLEANQAELLKLWYMDEAFQTKTIIEKERKKRYLRKDLQDQLADNRQRVQEQKIKQKDQDRKMVEHELRMIQEEDMKIKKRRHENTVLLRAEIAASLAVKETWRRRYEKAFKDEDERIAHIAMEKEAQRKKMIDKKMELRMAKDAAIDKLAKKLLHGTHKQKEWEETCKLYQEEQRSKWAKESARIALRKQCVIIESLKEMAKRDEIIAQRKAKDKAIDTAFTRCILEKWKEDDEKQKKHDEVRRAKNIQYREELKEAIIKNRISYAMNILERQSEICMHDQKTK